MRLLLFPNILLILLVACQSNNDPITIPDRYINLENLIVYSEDVEPASNIKLIKEVSFQDNVEENILLGGWAGFEVDDLGRLFIGDYPGHSIHIFNSDGTYYTRLGREGSGPGEFRMIGTLKIIQNRLYVRDPMQFKMNIFSLETLEVDEIINMNRIPTNQDNFDELKELYHAPDQVYPFNGGSTYLAGYQSTMRIPYVDLPSYNLNQERSINYYLIDEEWEVMGKVFDLRDIEDITVTVAGEHRYNPFSVPFLGKSILTISDDDQIFTVWTKDLLIKTYGPDGSYQHAFYYPYVGRELIRDEAFTLFPVEDEWHKELIQHADLPDNWPAVNSILADDEGRLWVSLNAKKGVLEWWILTSKGELISSFEWPDNRSIEKVKDDFVYVRETDELDRVTITRYRFEL